MSHSYDVVVIGAGPAGLAAATVAAGQGASTLLLDEQPAVGGQIYRAIERTRNATELRRVLGPDFTHGDDLVARYHASGAEYAPGSAVWQITADREVWSTRAGKSQASRAGAVILATGAMERPVPVPGWTLPGVMTAGAVQILLKSSGLLPSKGLVLAGSGPLLYLLAWQLVQAGCMPTALLDTATSDNFNRALRHLPGVLRPTALGYLRKGIALKLALRRAGQVTYKGVTNIRIEGGERCEAVSFRCGEAPMRVVATAVALHEGVIPAQQATRSIGCAHVWDEVQRCFRPQLDVWGNTSVAGILVAGDAGGIGGARAAEHGGRIAGWEALRHLGRIDAAGRDQTAAADHAGLAAHLAVRPMLDQMFAPREEILRPANEVVVCRCEEITAGDIRGVFARGCQGPNQAKAFLRAGMGPCQGRMCGPAVSELISAELDQPVADVGYYRIRPPLKPVTVGELAALEIDA